MFRPHRSARLAALMLGLVVAGCDDPVAPAENKEIAIGGLFSLAGNWATLGVTSKAAMEIGIEDVNQYLAAGATGFHFTASIQDTKLIPETALTAVTAMKANRLTPSDTLEAVALVGLMKAG